MYQRWAFPDAGVPRGLLHIQCPSTLCDLCLLPGTQDQGRRFRAAAEPSVSLLAVHCLKRPTLELGNFHELSLRSLALRNNLRGFLGTFLSQKGELLFSTRFLEDSRTVPFSSLCLPLVGFSVLFYPTPREP